MEIEMRFDWSPNHGICGSIESLESRFSMVNHIFIDHSLIVRSFASTLDKQLNQESDLKNEKSPLFKNKWRLSAKE